MDVIHDDLPSLAGTGDCRVIVGRALRRFFEGHGIAVIFASDSNIQRCVGREGSGMLLETFDQIDTFPSGFDIMDFTKLEKLFTLKRM